MTDGEHININWDEFFRLVQSDLSISLNDLQKEQIKAYYNFLLEFNQHTNLTRISAEDTPILHFFDSIVAVKYLDFSSYSSLIDIGTGPGFPGVPLKILFPHLQLTLLDSKIKKVRFLQELLAKLNIEGSNCLHSRAEDLAIMPQFKEQFDLVTARAVSQTKELIELLSPFKNKKGKILLYKGPNLKEELGAADKQLKAKQLIIEKCEEFELPHNKGSRSLVIISSSQS